MHLSTSTACNYFNATPSSKRYVSGEAILRAEHLLLCGIPNLETIKQVDSEGILRPNQWNKIIYKMFRTNTHVLFPILNLISYIFFLSGVDCIPTKLIKIFGH
jgi:hypothetical protein